MAARLKRAIPDVNVDLVGGGKGNFIVVVDGVTVWHKKNMGNEFPDEAALVSSIAKR